MLTTSRTETVRRAAFFATACGCLFAGNLSAQAPVTKKSDPGLVEPASDRAPILIEDRQVFNFDDTSAEKVLEWFSSKTGKPVLFAGDSSLASKLQPLALNFTKDEKYSLPEVIDILNNALLLQKHYMLPRGSSFALYAADVSIPLSDVPRVRVTDLPKRRRTEIVSIIVDSKKDPEEVAPEIKRQLGHFGEVYYVPNSSNIILQAPAGKLLRVLKENDLIAGNGPTAIPPTIRPSVSGDELPVVKFSGPSGPHVGERMVFKVEVRAGSKGTGKDFSVLIRLEAGRFGAEYSKHDSVMSCNLPEVPDCFFDPTGKLFHARYVHVGSLRPNESRTLTFGVSLDRPRSVRLAAFFGLQPSVKSGPAPIPFHNLAEMDLPIKHDLEDLLPKPPPTQDRLSSLPQKLAEVPEVHFQQPISKHTSVYTAQSYMAEVIDKINFLNSKKTDGFVEQLTSKRRDLAGLPFVIGDACRMSEGASRQFVTAREDVRRAAMNKTPLFQDFEAVPLRAPVPTTMEEKAARRAYLLQLLGDVPPKVQLELVEYLARVADADATRALAKLAIFSEEAEIRSAAVRALKLRRDKDYTDILVAGLNYPWPAVAERTCETIVALGRTDLVPQLRKVLADPDPRAPIQMDVKGTKTTVVRELVRINHHHNCLLCHAPAVADRNLTGKRADEFAALTAQVPVPSEAMNAYYSPRDPDILVRFDVTYLRQDFSLNLPVADAAPWPELQRYDFLVRSREVTDEEAAQLRSMVPETTLSPYRRAALSAIGELGVNDKRD